MRIAAILAALVALAASPAIADEEWVVFGGDGGARAYDRSSIERGPGGSVTVRHALHTTAAQTVGGQPYNTAIGQLTLNCQARTAHLGSMEFSGADGVVADLQPPGGPAFQPVTPDDPRGFFLEALCGTRKPPDPYLAVGRDAALALMRRLAGEAHVRASAAKGWAFAIANPAAIFALDTSSWRREGDVVRVNEIAWMRNNQTTEGQSWRYMISGYEYDCAGRRRRGAGELEIYAGDNSLVHKETVAEAPWTPVGANPFNGAMLDMACGQQPLWGLPTGERAAMVRRLRELAALM